MDACMQPYTILVFRNACIYPQNPAQGLAICAIIFLLVAQVTISAVGGCWKSRAIPSETKRIVGIICAVVSWIAAGIAWALLVDGAVWNANVVRFGTAAPFCHYFPDGAFAGAAALSLAATALGVTSFMKLRREGATSKPRELDLPNMSGEKTTPHAGSSPTVAMDHPQFPQPGAPAKQPQQPLPTVVNTMGQPQPQVVYVMQTPTQPQYPVVLPHGLQVPAVSPPDPLQEVVDLPEKQQKGITKGDVIEIGTKMLMGAVKQSLASDNTDPAAMAGDILLSMATGGNGDASC